INNSNHTLGTTRRKPVIDIIEANTSGFRVSEINIMTAERNTLIMRIDDAMTRKIKQRYGITVKATRGEGAIQTLSYSFPRCLCIGKQLKTFYSKRLSSLRTS